MNLIYLIGGPILMLVGISILIFRAPYAAWWNRVYARRGQAESFTTNGSLIYGFAAFGIGAFFLIVRGIL